MYLKSIQQADFLALLSQGSLLLPELMTLVTMEMVYFKEEEHEMKLRDKWDQKRYRTDTEKCLCAVLLLV